MLKKKRSNNLFERITQVFRKPQAQTCDVPLTLQEILGAEMTILETEEADLRMDLELQQMDEWGSLMIVCDNDQQKCMWDGSSNVTDRQIGYVYSMAFKQMLALAIQNFAALFPDGVHTVISDRLGLYLLALLSIDMANVDDEMSGFALSVVPGSRMSLQTCPKHQLPAFFLFMAFKSQLVTSKSVDKTFSLVEMKHCVYQLYIQCAALESISPRYADVIRLLQVCCTHVAQHAMYHQMTDWLYNRLQKFDTIHADDGNDQCAIHWQRGEKIGGGAFGSVFKCLNVLNGELMAMKEITLSSDEPPNDIMTEVRIMKRLRNDHIVSYLGCEVSKETHHMHIFMELVPGGSLSTLLLKFGAFHENTIVVYTRQILRGLFYLHSHGVIHRDIKCSNILVNDKGVIKLSDFGLSSEDCSTTGTSSGFNNVVGTPLFMAPEVIRGCAYSEASDVWALGCTVIEMATAQQPWFEREFSSPLAAMYHIAQSGTTPAIPDDLSDEAKSFIQLCHAIDPCQRGSIGNLLKHPFLDSTVMKGQSLIYGERQTSSVHNDFVSDDGTLSDHRDFLKSLSFCSDDVPA
eukprot:PhF_6_TR20549/c0_g1_i1/m.29679